MPLVFAGMTPHPPLLIPAIGKEEGLNAIFKTREALLKLEQDLYLSKPHVLIIISPHEGRYDDAFVVNAHTSFETSFEDFGDSVTSLSIAGAPDLAAKISHVGNTMKFPIRLISEERVSHGTGVPIHCLTTHIPNLRVLPIGFCNVSPKDHVRFGQILKDIIMESNKNIAVISSGDLAHCLTKDAPVEQNERGAIFDQSLMDLLAKKDVEAIAQMDNDMVAAAHECGYRTLLILLGIIQHMDYTFKRYSYEYPYGVGYLVGNFDL